MVRQQVGWMIVLVLGILVPTVVAQTPTSGWKIVGYYPSWSTYAVNYQVSRIPAQNLTHVVYAFAKISATGELVPGDAFADIQKRFPGDGNGTASHGGFGQLVKLKKRNPHLKTLLAVGGWSLSGRFSDVALTAAARQKFARSCVALVTRYGFDGLDIDWEFPVEGGLAGNKKRPVDKSNYTLLVAELRKQFDTRGRQNRRRYLITAATSAAAAHYRHLELGKMSAFLDWFNLMAYDFAGPWSSRTGFHAGLAATGEPGEDPQLNVVAAVNGYLKAGVPAGKIVLGVPVYGRGWTGVAPADQGLFAAYQGIPRGTREGGVYEYRDLLKTQVRPAIRHWHAKAQVPWLYDPATRTMISYEDVESVSAKVKYVRSKNLGGMMAWDLSKDAEGSQSLLQTMRRGLPRQKK
ncbi:MAG: glycoside hydrolase family 18 protein [Pirellulaceae bacterium]